MTQYWLVIFNIWLFETIVMKCNFIVKVKRFWKFIFFIGNVDFMKDPNSFDHTQLEYVQIKGKTFFLIVPNYVNVGVCSLCLHCVVPTHIVVLYKTPSEHPFSIHPFANTISQFDLWISLCILRLLKSYFLSGVKWLIINLQTGVQLGFFCNLKTFSWKKLF